MRVLITGGAGFIGSHLCHLLHAEGHDVVCIDNLITGKLSNVSDLQGTPRFTFIESDVSGSPMCGCAGDLDGDGDTDLADLGILLADFGCTGGGCAGDLDGDGDTDLADLGILLADFGCTP